MGTISRVKKSFGCYGYNKDLVPNRDVMDEFNNL